MLPALPLAPAVNLYIEPLVLLASCGEAAAEFLLELRIRVLQLDDEPLHVAFNGRLMAEDELLLLDEALPRGLDGLPLLLAEVALSPFDWSLAIHFFINYICGHFYFYCGHFLTILVIF